jgi:hypothetical protein
MNQISITFPKKTKEKLYQNAQQKEITIAQYIRDLVDIGLRVEEMSAQKKIDGDKPEPLMAELDLFKNLLKKDLVSSYEMLYLVRHILTKMPEKTAGELDAFAEEARIRSRSFVDGLFDQMPR